MERVPIPQPQKEHLGILDSIDENYILAIEAAADLRKYLQTRVGNAHDYFVTFYTCFDKLFTATYLMREMESSMPLSQKILKWREAQGINDMRFRHGLLLFEKYTSELFKNGVLSLRR